MADPITALARRLDAELLACRSATQVLESWCGYPVSAFRTDGGEKVLPGHRRRRLRLMPHERLAYRHVKLIASGNVLSEADNWYIPGRLTSDMNIALERTDRPFGKVIAPLAPSRRVLSSRMLCDVVEDTDQKPSPAGGNGVSCPVLEQEALLADGNGRALCLVREVYMVRLLTQRRADTWAVGDLEATR